MARLLDAPPAADAENSLPALICLRALPIWMKQVETARIQAEHAVIEISARFAAIAQRVDSALHASRRNDYLADASQDPLAGEQSLSRVLEALRGMQRRHDEMTGEISKLLSYTEKLAKMSRDVEWVSFRTVQFNRTDTAAKPNS